MAVAGGWKPGTKNEPSTDATAAWAGAAGALEAGRRSGSDPSPRTGVDLEDVLVMVEVLEVAGKVDAGRKAEREEVAVEKYRLLARVEFPYAKEYGRWVRCVFQSDWPATNTCHASGS